MLQIENTSFTRDGLTFAVSVCGEGDPLILLHGGGSRASQFAQLLPLLSRKFKIYAYDQRGFGATGARPEDAITHQAWADDLDALVAQIGAPSVYLCGWSLGATIALNYASQHPEEVKALVLLGAPHPDRPIDRNLFKKRLDLIANGATAADVVAQTFGMIEKSFSPLTLVNRPDAVAHVRREHLDHDVSLAARVVDGYDTRPNFDAFLPKVICPVHLIVGEHDNNCGLAGAEELRRRLQYAKIVTVPNCGHYYAVEQPDAVADVIIDALTDPNV